MWLMPIVNGIMQILEQHHKKKEYLYGVEIIIFKACLFVFVSSLFKMKIIQIQVNTQDHTADIVDKKLHGAVKRA